MTRKSRMLVILAGAVALPIAACGDPPTAVRQDVPGARGSTLKPSGGGGAAAQGDSTRFCLERDPVTGICGQWGGGGG